VVEVEDDLVEFNDVVGLDQMEDGMAEIKH
jgi:hypothetical protein